MDKLCIFFQLLGGIVMAVGYIPQIIQILKNKSSRGLNSQTYGMIFTGIFLYELYAINLVLVTKNGYMFLITNTVSLFLSGMMFFLIKKYRKGDKNG